MVTAVQAVGGVADLVALQAVHGAGLHQVELGVRAQRVALPHHVLPAFVRLRLQAVLRPSAQVAVFESQRSVAHDTRLRGRQGKLSI